MNAGYAFLNYQYYYLKNKIIVNKNRIWIK